MTTEIWINLTAAVLIGGGTLFLGIMAWRNIHQTRSIQKAEKRERLLNEIIEWVLATDRVAISRQTKGKHDLWKTKLAYKYCIAKSEYIREIASLRFNNLLPSVQELISRVEQAIKVTEETINKDDLSNDLKNCEEELNNSAKELLKKLASSKHQSPS